jgi:hypothetical protein
LGRIEVILPRYPTAPLVIEARVYSSDRRYIRTNNEGKLEKGINQFPKRVIMISCIA